VVAPRGEVIAPHSHGGPDGPALSLLASARESPCLEQENGDAIDRSSGTPLGFARYPVHTRVGSEIALTARLDRWERLYREEGPRLWRALLAYAGDRDVASDALAEAFTQAIARGDAIREPSAWIWTTAFRVAAAELAKRSKATLFRDLGLTYEMSDPVPHLFAALAQLSPKQRAAIVLHDYADRPTKEIAEILGARLPTVHVHLSEGRKRLRGLLEAQDG
jgi:RNA polymerase sigma factor (sigma-70 family)